MPRSEQDMSVHQNDIFFLLASELLHFDTLPFEVAI